MPEPYCAITDMESTDPEEAGVPIAPYKYEPLQEIPFAPAPV